MNRLSQFYKDDSGAVTVDWVVLTAAIVGIAMAVIALISSGVNTASNGINDTASTAGGGWDFIRATSVNVDEYIADYLDNRNDDSGFFDDPEALYAGVSEKMAADAPDGFDFAGDVAVGSGAPVYEQWNPDTSQYNYNIGGTDYTSDEVNGFFTSVIVDDVETSVWNPPTVPVESLSNQIPEGPLPT